VLQIILDLPPSRDERGLLKDVADAHISSVQTIKKHLRTIKEKLGVSGNNAGLIGWLGKNGFIRKQGEKLFLAEKS
jgi:hypothetical protein